MSSNQFTALVHVDTALICQQIVINIESYFQRSISHQLLSNRFLVLFHGIWFESIIFIG